MGNNIDYYYENILCWNCGTWDNVEIGKGITIDEYNDNNVCSNCGCHRRLISENIGKEKDGN